MMMRRFDASVLALIFALALAFSSCTCQRDVPEPPQRTSKLDGGRAWSGLPTPIRDRPGERVGQIEREIPTRRLRPTSLPTQGATPAQEAEIPEDFPEGVPVFENAEVFGVQNLAAGAKNVLFHTDGDVPEVFGFYKDSMSREGWDVKQEYEQSNQSFLSFEKDDVITNMTVARDPNTGKQVIAIMYYKQQPLPFEEF